MSIHNLERSIIIYIALSLLCLMGSCCYILGNLREFMVVSQLFFCTIMPFFLGFVSSLLLLQVISPPPVHPLWGVSVLNLLLHGDFIGLPLSFSLFYFHGTISFFLSCELVCFFSFFCLVSFICCLHVSGHFISHSCLFFLFHIYKTNAAW